MSDLLAAEAMVATAHDALDPNLGDRQLILRFRRMAEVAIRFGPRRFLYLTPSTAQTVDTIEEAGLLVVKQRPRFAWVIDLMPGEPF